MSRKSKARALGMAAVAHALSTLLGCGEAAQRADEQTGDEPAQADGKRPDARAAPSAPIDASDGGATRPEAGFRSRAADAGRDSATEGDAADETSRSPAPGRASDAALERPGDGALASPPACPTTSLTVGDNRSTLQHQGRSRSYIVYVPSGIDAQSALPLVLDFHGNGGSGAQEKDSSGWREKANEQKFLVAYPNGVGNAWNVGNCCGEALSGNVDDVGFARAIISAVSRAACVDPKRVYATGLSNGAGLAHRLACEAADVIAAIAAASADLVTDPCTPARPISELSVRGTRDTLVAYAGGNTGSTGWYSPGAKGTLELWKKIDGCSGTAETTREYCESYTQCRDGVEVTLCSLPGAGHLLYSNSLDFSMPDVTWEMFERQKLP